MTGAAGRDDASAKRAGVIGVLSALTLLALAALVLDARDRAEPLHVSTDRSLYVRSPRVVRAGALTFRALAADVYWLRTIQHFGGDRLTHRREHPFELLEPLLTLTTALDPKFVAAYRFGAIFLAEPPPGGPGDADAAIALLRHGLDEDPEKWQYAHDLGFLELWHHGDARAAAEWFRRASAMPGAPNWLQPLAATTMMTGADRRVAGAWLQEMARSATEPWIRRIAEQRLAQIIAMDQIDQLRALVPRFQQKMGRNPTGWADFMAAGLLIGVPVDPAGAPYVYFPASGLVRLDPASPLAPLPTLPDSGR